MPKILEVTQMHIILDRHFFAQALNKVSKAISNRTTIPILTGIKITIADDQCLFSASDSDISIQATIPTHLDDKEIIQVVTLGSIVLPAKLITEIVKNLPAENVEIQVQ